MNCDEATLVLAWTPLGNGVHEAPISYLLPACYWCWVSVCVRLSVCRKKDGHYPRTLFTWMSASPAGHRFQRTCSLQVRTCKRFRCNLYRVAVVSSLYTTLNICQVATLYIAAQYLSGGRESILYELCSSRVYSFSAIDIILLVRGTSTANTPAHIMHLNCTPGAENSTYWYILLLLLVCYHYSYTTSRTTRVPTRTFRTLMTSTAVLLRIPPLPLTVFYLRLLPLLVDMYGAWP